MCSEFKCIKSLEWCTKLPERDCPLESPIFLVNDSECFFRFALEEGSTSYYNMYVEVKRGPSQWQPCKVRCLVEFEKENNFSLKNKTSTVSNYGTTEIWYIEMKILLSKLPLNFVDGDKFKFKVIFEDIDDAILKVKKEMDAETDKKSQKTLDTKAIVHFQALSRDFTMLLNDTPSSDVEITCETKKFKAHRIVLGARSSVLSAMLKSEMVEGKTGLIKIEDIKTTIFDFFLRYLYSGTLPTLTIDTAQQFYEVGDKYDVKELKNTCSEFLTENLSEANVCEMLVLADLHNDDSFKKNIMSYIVEKDVPQRDSQWSNFCENYPLLAIKVQNLYIQKLGSK